MLKAAGGEGWGSGMKHGPELHLLLDRKPARHDLGLLLVLHLLPLLKLPPRVVHDPDHRGIRPRRTGHLEQRGVVRGVCCLRLQPSSMRQ